MKPYYNDPYVKIYQGNCLEIMGQLPEESIQCCVTSPPYWGLRKYEGQQEMVWGNQDCEHQWLSETRVGDKREGGCSDIWRQGTGAASTFSKSQGLSATTNTCSLCSAWRGAYGLEPTPEMYVEHTIEFLRAIRRVLRKDGVVFWNIGDSYWGGKGQSGQGSPEYQAARRNVSLNRPHDHIGGPKQTRPSDGSHPIVKPKDLCLIPFRVALAAQEDGWWVRSIIIWAKPNPMPESVKDRPTESHEYILMLTKSKNYYWDQDAVTEKTTLWNADGFRHGNV